MQRAFFPSKYRLAPAACLLALLTGFFWTTAFTSSHDGRRVNFELGRWLHRRCGPFHSVFVSLDAAGIGYPAKGSMPLVIGFGDNLVQNDAAAHGVRDLVVLNSMEWQPAQQSRVIADFTKLGWRLLDPRMLPPANGEFAILVRETSAADAVREKSVAAVAGRPLTPPAAN